MDKTINNLESTVALQTQNMERLGGTLDRLSEALNQKATKKQAFGFAAVVGAITLLVVCVLFAITYVSLGRLNDVADQNKANGEFVRSCLEPGGECAKLAARGQIDQRNKFRSAVREDLEFAVNQFIVSEGGDPVDIVWPDIPPASANP